MACTAAVAEAIPSGGSMAVVWPAAGVGLVWMLRFALRGWRGTAETMGE